MLRPYIYYNILYLSLVSVPEICQKIYSVYYRDRPLYLHTVTLFNFVVVKKQFEKCYPRWKAWKHEKSTPQGGGGVFSYKLRYIVGFELVEMVISTNSKPTIYHTLYDNTDPAWDVDNRKITFLHLPEYFQWFSQWCELLLGQLVQLYVVHGGGPGAADHVRRRHDVLALAHLYGLELVEAPDQVRGHGLDVHVGRGRHHDAVILKAKRGLNYPTIMRRCPSVGLMLGQRHRRWTSIKLTLGQRLVFAGRCSHPKGHLETAIGIILTGVK